MYVKIHTVYVRMYIAVTQETMFELLTDFLQSENNPNPLKKIWPFPIIYLLNSLVLFHLVNLEVSVLGLSRQWRI